MRNVGTSFCKKSSSRHLPAVPGGHRDTATLLLPLLTLPGSCSFSHAPPVILTSFPSIVCSLQSLPPAHNSNFLPIAQGQAPSVIPDLPLSPPLPGHTQPHQAAYKSQGLGFIFFPFSDLDLCSNSRRHPHFIPTVDSHNFTLCPLLGRCVTKMPLTTICTLPAAPAWLLAGPYSS